MNMKIKFQRKRKGIVILMFGVLTLFVLAPLVGLVFDVGVAYAAKARLQSASDAAVIAATRSLSRGMDDSTRVAAANETAQRFFAANLTSPWLGISHPVATVTFPSAPPRTTVIKVDVSADISTYFMRLIGTTTMTLRTTSAASRRDVNIMIVLDRSGSLASSGACGPMREAAKSFVFTLQQGRDKVGLVTFGTSYHVDKPLTQDFRTSGTDIITLLDNINCTGWTNSAAAYSLAYDQLVAMNEPGVLNAILFFTDGMPNTVTMPRVQMLTATMCNVKGNRFGVLTQGGGIFEAAAPGNPPITSDSTVISNSAGCAFSGGGLPDVATEAVALTRAVADGNTGDATGDIGNTMAGGVGPGHGSGPAGSGNLWDNWPADQDAFGNSLFGYMPVTTDGSGRITVGGTNILNGGLNALANASTRVRSDSVGRGLDVVTYVIGEGNFTGTDQLDILNRVANTPISPTHDPSKPVGLMVYASTPGELEAAFAQVAAELLRLSM